MKSTGTTVILLIIVFQPFPVCFAIAVKIMSTCMSISSE